MKGTESRHLVYELFDVTWQVTGIGHKLCFSINCILSCLVPTIPRVRKSLYRTSGLIAVLYWLSSLAAFAMSVIRPSRLPQPALHTLPGTVLSNLSMSARAGTT